MSVGIVGLGISGLQLALFLQQGGLATTLYSPRPVTALVSGPIPNFVTRWAPTLERERTLGVVDPDARPNGRLRIRFAAQPEIVVEGVLRGPADTTDFRIYLPLLLDTYLNRGGTLRVEACGPEQAANLIDRHDLLVAAAGRDGWGGTFARDPARSPHKTPPRLLVVGLFDGIDLPTETDLELTVVPGVAEVFHIRFRSFHGVTSQIAIGAIPDGPLGGTWQRLCEDNNDDTAADCSTEFLRALRTHAPHLAARVDEPAFRIHRPEDLLRGRILPVVRQAWARVGERIVMAVGDAWVLNDPVMGQGANLASRAAFTLGAAISAGGPYDETFAQRTEAAMWQQAEAPTTLTNTFLDPPPPHVLDLLVRASTDRCLATQIVDGIGHPEDMLALLTPPNSMAAC